MPDALDLFKVPPVTFQRGEFVPDALGRGRHRYYVGFRNGVHHFAKAQDLEYACEKFDAEDGVQVLTVPEEEEV